MTRKRLSDRESSAKEVRYFQTIHDDDDAFRTETNRFVAFAVLSRKIANIEINGAFLARVIDIVLPRQTSLSSNSKFPKVSTREPPLGRVL